MFDEAEQIAATEPAAREDESHSRQSCRARAEGLSVLPERAAPYERRNQRANAVGAHQRIANIYQYGVLNLALTVLLGERRAPAIVNKEVQPCL